MKEINEKKTRKLLIDPALEKAGWSLHNHRQVGIEIPVDGYDAEPWNGVTDYCLYRENGDVLAVVEAKRTTHDPRLAEQQAVHYVTEIAKHQAFQPFAFMTKQFYVSAEKFNSVFGKMIESERQAEHLFQSLLKRAFTGEL